MRHVTEQELLDITAEEFKSLGFFDTRAVVRVWEEAGRIKSLPDEVNEIQYGDVEAFNAFLAKNNAAYYADCREDFFLYKAVQKALDEGKQLVYVEDLS